MWLSAAMSLQASNVMIRGGPRQNEGGQREGKSHVLAPEAKHKTGRCSLWRVMWSLDVNALLLCMEDEVMRRNEKVLSVGRSVDLTLSETMACGS